MLIAFMGQSGLRSQAQFDADVNKIVSTIAEVRNEATAGVNLTGLGDPNKSPGIGGCPANGNLPGTANVFAGTSWSADSSAGPSAPAIFTVDYYVAQIKKTDTDAQGALTGKACIIPGMTRTITIPSGVKVSVTAATPAMPGGRILFVRNLDGTLKGCAITDLSADPTVAYGGGACTPFAPVVPLTAASFIFTFSDTSGHKSQVTVDPSGMAKRQN
jgi:hypothetical protein